MLPLKKKLRHYLAELRSTRRVIASLLWMLLFILGYTLSFAHFEKSSLLEGFWQAWQTQTTVGYGNQPAVTEGGRFASILFGTAGLVYLGVFITRLAEFFSLRYLRRRDGGMHNPNKNSICIFNYPGKERSKQFIKEIRVETPNLPLCFIDQNLDQLPEEIAALRKIHFVKGEFTSTTTYDFANVAKSRSIIVFPQNRESKDSDAISQLITQLVARFIPVDIPIYVVLVSEENRWLFDQRRVHFIHAHFDILALAQESLDPYSATSIEKLLLNSESMVPLTVEPLSFVGKSWFDLEQTLSKNSQEEENRLTPFALIRGAEPVLNVPSSITIQESDKLLLIGTQQGRQQWKKLNKARK